MARYFDGIAPAMATKKVLVKLEGSCKIISFMSSDGQRDLDILSNKVRESYPEEIPDDARLILQCECKDEVWSGEFIDIDTSQVIDSGSVVIIIKKVFCMHVSFVHFYYNNYLLFL